VIILEFGIYLSKRKKHNAGDNLTGICKLPLQIETFIINLQNACYNLPEVHMKKITLNLSIIFLLFLLTACNLPGNPTPDADLLATQVSIMLTESAIQTILAPTEPITPSPTQKIVLPSPTETSEPTMEASPTPTATETLTPTPTPDQNDPAQLLGEPMWTQDFGGSDSPWDFDAYQATFLTANGSLNLTAQGNANWHSWYVSSPRLKNAYLEATFTMANCSGFDRFGLVVRSSSDAQQFYFLSITCDGRWGFFRMSEDVEINEISGYQQASSLATNSSSPHRGGIWMEGTNFTFYLDGEEIGSASDSTLTGDGFTGFLIAYADSPGFTVSIDKLQYWNLP
jgi:hypothetical protein